MDDTTRFKEWRAEEIAKLFLLKSDYKLTIDKFPTPLFDFFITLKDDAKVKFAVEVKTTTSFQANLRKQLAIIKEFRDANIISIPVLLFKIDEKNERGELDFLIIPSFKESKLLVRNDFKFEVLNQVNLKSKIEAIIKWHNR
ncbi:MAG TPA: hypothetical protein VGD22_05600 [Sphingobacteriaceae bacterium]